MRRWAIRVGGRISVVVEIRWDRRIVKSRLALTDDDASGRSVDAGIARWLSVARCWMASHGLRYSSKMPRRRPLSRDDDAIQRTPGSLLIADIPHVNIASFAKVKRASLDAWQCDQFEVGSKAKVCSRGDG